MIHNCAIATVDSSVLDAVDIPNSNIAIANQGKSKETIVYSRKAPCRWVYTTVNGAVKADIGSVVVDL